MNDYHSHVSITTPVDFLSLVPHLLNYHPSAGIAGVFLAGTQVALAACIANLSDPDTIAMNFIKTAYSSNCDRGILIAYCGPKDRETLEAIRKISDQLESNNIDVPTLFRVHDQRYYELGCDQPDCCPPNGSPLPQWTPTSDLVAATTGELPAASRDDITNEYSPVDRSAAKEVEATMRLRLATEDPSLTMPPKEALTNAVRWMDELPSVNGILDLVICAVRREVRTELYKHIVTTPRPNGARAWLFVARHFTGPIAARALTLHGLCAYRNGDGVRARIALESALDRDPFFNDVDLFLTALNEGVHPDALEQQLFPE